MIINKEKLEGGRGKMKFIEHCIIHFTAIINTILAAANKVYTSHGIDCVITCGQNGKHADLNSKHYTNEALDFRTKNIPGPELRKIIAAEIRLELGNDYDVVVEIDHLHIEHDKN